MSLKKKQTQNMHSRGISHTHPFLQFKTKCAAIPNLHFTLSFSTFGTPFLKVCSSHCRIWPSWSHWAKQWSWKACQTLECSCCKENLKKLGQNSQKAVRIWNSLHSYKYQQNQTEKTAQVMRIKQMTKLESCSQVLKSLLVEDWQ